MYYTLQFQHDQDDGKYHFEVAVIWGETRDSAWEKAMNLLKSYNAFEIKFNPLDLETVKERATKGGVFIAHFEDYVGI